MNKNYDSICCFRSSNESTKRRICWELTTDCNLNCAFCHRMKEEKKYYDYCKIDATIKMLKDNHIEKVILSGGEPLLHPNIYSMIERLYNEQFEIDICTNGVLIDKNVVKYLKPYIKEISVSIDGYNADRHESMRLTPGCFKKTVDAIILLQNNGIDVHTTTVIDEAFVDYMIPMAEYLYKLNVKSMAFLGVIPIDSGKNPLLEEDIQQKIERNINYLRSEYYDISINTKQLLKKSNNCKCGAGKIVFGLDYKAEKIYDCLLTRDRNGKKYNETSVGFCPGSKYLTGKVVNNA